MTFYDIIKVIFLWPFSLIYWLVAELRADAYKIGLFRSHKASVPVISIGNIAAGGTGKTPMAIYVAKVLLDKGMKVAVLSRGYKRRTKGRNQKASTQLVSDGFSVQCSVDEAGDEPYLIASRLLGTKARPGAMVVVGKDRVAGAELAVKLGAQVIILDDGFQHLRLKRDLDIVLLDSQRPYDNGWLLPAGMLREPRGALGRADAVVFTRCGVEKQKAEGRRRKAKTKNGKAEIFETRHKTGRFYRFDGGSPPDPERLRNSRIRMFSGIARPESFEQSARQAGLAFSAHLKYPDHHRYSRAQLKQIAMMAGKCDYLLTTEKDAARLPSGIDLGKPLLVLPIEIEFFNEADQQRFNQLVMDRVYLK